MKTIFLIIAITFSLGSRAQVTSVSLQASGLTCSMCSNSIYKALKTLEFVEDVNPDIKSYTFQITFKENSLVDFEKIKMKVEKAGFSVSSFVATIDFNNVQVKNNQQVSFDDKTLVFRNVKDQTLQGIKQVKLIDKGYVSPKEYKSYALSELPTGHYHANF